MKKTLFGLLDERKKKKDKERDLLKKKFNSLSLVERNAYEGIIQKHETPSLFLNSLYLIPQTIIYVTIFFYCLMFVFEIELTNSLIILVSALLKYWIVFIIVGLIFDFIMEFNSMKLKKELLLGRK